MTRAKEKLILTGIKKDDIDWNAKGEVTAIDRLSGRSYFDWIKKALPMIPKQDYRLKIYTLEDLLWQQEGNELLHEMNRQIFYERLNDQIPNEKKTAAFCAAAAAWKAAVRQLRCHGSVGNRSEQP